MKTESEKSLALVDTNLLVYAYAENSPKRQRAAELLNDCFAGKIKLALSFQNLGEFCNVSLTRYLLSTKDAWERVEEFIGCGNFIKLSYGTTTFQKALEIVNSSKIDFWDAVLAATMKENAIDIIYTEDSDFGKVEGIKAVNPFQ
ncbi:PIN domain-containing protein [Candidatus Woesearchaeota archaeon]|nr:PIN domain-containing protein [Candidatus Woesearchaeota archaeon]